MKIVLQRDLKRQKFLLCFLSRKGSVVEMARITKNASTCCAAFANFVRMLHRIAFKHNYSKFTLHRAAPQVKYLLNFHQHQKKVSSLAYDI